MAERLIDSGVAHIVPRGRPERPARRGENDAAHVVPPSRGERLEDRVVLGIDREDHRPGLAGPTHEQRSGADQALLVGNSHRCATLNGGHARAKPRSTSDRRHHPIGRALGGLDNRVGTGSGLDARMGERRLEFAIALRVGDRCKTGAHFSGEGSKRRRVFLCRDRLHPEAVAIATQEIDRARSDGPRRTEQSDAQFPGARGRRSMSERDDRHRFTTTGGRDRAHPHHPAPDRPMLPRLRRQGNRPVGPSARHGRG